MSNSVNLSLDVTKTGIQNPLIKVRHGDGGFETLRTTVTANGEPMDLQGWTITFMGTTAGNHKIVDDNVTLVEAPDGIFDYTPSKAWGMDVGEFKIAYFKFVKGDGSASSANFRVNVIEAVDLTQEEAQNYISIVDATIAEAREHLESSLADVTDSVAATSEAASSLAVYVSDTASSAVNTINDTTSSAVTQVNSATSNASSVASSAVDNVSDVASNAVANINDASDTYVKKSGDTMTGGLTGGQVELSETGDLNALNATGKYVQTSDENASGWTNRPANAPAAAFFVDIIGSTDKSSITQVYYANTTGRVWVRTIVSNETYTKWVELANDANVVHNTETETIAGDKTFTGKLNFSGTFQSPIKNYEADLWLDTVGYIQRTGNYVTVYLSEQNGTQINNGYVSPQQLPVGYRPMGSRSFMWFRESTLVGEMRIRTDGHFESVGTMISGRRIANFSYITNDDWPA